MSDERATYLDASALVKLVVPEPETPALLDVLRHRPAPVSSALAYVEVIRGVRRHHAPAVASARRLMSGLELLAIDEPLLYAAADLEQESLRSLDAVHVAAARALGDDLGEFVTYDRRLAEAAEAHGLPVVAPA